MTLPLSLRGKYQLVLLGAAGSSSVDACASRLDNALKVAFAHLGVNVDKFLVRVRAGMTDPDIDRRMLSVAVYFGLTPTPSLSPSDDERLGHLLTDGSLIIPVVVDTASFGMLVPGPRSPISTGSLSLTAGTILSGSRPVFWRALVFSAKGGVSSLVTGGSRRAGWQHSSTKLSMQAALTYSSTIMACCALESRFRTFFGTAWRIPTWPSYSTLPAF